MKRNIYIALSILLVALSAPLSSAPAKKESPDLVRQYYVYACRAFDAENWKEAGNNFAYVGDSYPFVPYCQEAYFYAGWAYYEAKEYDIANHYFSAYLKHQTSPKFFQETIEYKFVIAEHFRCGAKKHLFCTSTLPKWISGEDLALEIYDEVIAAVPSSELAAKALFYKGNLLWAMKEFDEGTEAFQTLIRRFPKNELAPQCYVLIAKLYIDQTRHEYLNSDLLAFADINLKKFRQDFPRDERIEEVEGHVLQIKEIYAKGLCDIAQFYEITYNRPASIIYYVNTIERFPETSVAQSCYERLQVICPRALEAVNKRLEEKRAQMAEIAGTAEAIEMASDEEPSEFRIEELNP